jgi:hypothetical protein
LGRWKEKRREAGEADLNRDEQSGKGEEREKNILTMYNEIIPSLLCALCFLLGRGLIPDRFPVSCMLVYVLLQRHLYLKKKFTNQ